MRASKTHLRAVLATRTAHAKKHPDDPAAVQAQHEAARDYYAHALEEHIEQTLAKAPPLSDGQRMRIAALLLGSS